MTLKGRQPVHDSAYPFRAIRSIVPGGIKEQHRRSRPVQIFSWNCPPGWLVIACVVLVVVMLATLLVWRRGQAKRLARSRADDDARDSAVTAFQESMLQSAQGLILRFEAIARRLPPDHPTRRELIEALDRAELVLEKGIDKAQHLRDQTTLPKDPGTHRRS
jgi:hypothetical protein